MNRTVLSVLCLFSLSGCTHYAWVKPGADTGMFQADSYACKQESLAVAPPAYQLIYPLAPYGGPDIVRTDCVERGPVQRCATHVVSRPYPPPPETVDLNAANRDDLYRACLGARGWAWTAIEERKE